MKLKINKYIVWIADEIQIVPFDLPCIQAICLQDTMQDTAKDRQIQQFSIKHNTHVDMYLTLLSDAIKYV